MNVFTHICINVCKTQDEVLVLVFCGDRSSRNTTHWRVMPFFGFVFIAVNSILKLKKP